MAQQTVVVDVALLGKMTGYIEMLVKDPHSTVFASLSDIYRTFGLHEEAVAVAQKGISMLPTYVPGLISLGRALAEKGDSAAASGVYRQALSLDSDNIAALTGLASSCLGCGESAEALTLLTRAQTIDPHNEVVQQLFPIVQKLAAISAPTPSAEESFLLPTEISQPQDDISVVEELPEPVAASPLIATATLADIYLKQGFTDKALTVFSDILAADPANLEIRQRYDALLQQINGPDLTACQEPEPQSSIAVERVIPATALPDVAGKAALITLYERWLDAVQRRRADVH